MARQLMQCIRRCAWYPTPPDKSGQPTSPLHYYDPESEEIPMGRSIPMSQEYLDPDDPWVANSGILDHFALPGEIDPETIETAEQYMARCRKGVRAPIDPKVMETTKHSLPHENVRMPGKRQHLDTHTMERETAREKSN